MELTGPDDRVVVEFAPDRPTLAVSRDGTTVLDHSYLPVSKLVTELHGVSWHDGGDVTLTDPEPLEETYEMVRGKAREREHRAVATTATFTHPEADGDVHVDLRVADEGVAVRYRVTGEGRDLTTGDATTFEVPREAVTYLTPFDEAHEASARQQPAREAEGEFCVPGLLEVDGQWCLLAEAGADGGYGASRLVADEDGLTFAAPETQVNAHYPFRTPWRVAVVGDLATVVESTLVTDLVGEAETDDSWVDPGRVAWSWWAESDSPDDFDRQRDYIDYAAERGWEYVLVDDGWQRRADEVPRLVEYAAERDVELFLWAHWTDLATESERAERLATWSGWGVAGVKVDFMDHDDQGRLAFYDRLAADAAAYDLLVNVHGSVVPTGLQRQYPHLMTYEGVMGAEYYKWSTLSAEHNCTLPYTRNVVGPMDYTPVTFSADSRHTSAGHELALSVVYESALQHFADGVDEYAARPAAERFLETVPAAWEGTRFVSGHPGTEATVARRARAEHDADGEWFLGSITAGPQRIVTADCSFLGDDTGKWTAHVVRDDGDDGLETEAWTVTGQEALDVVVAPNGGFVARFTRE
ncbi:MAG: glycoside hydrolase family 97 catalytic domain-containing protein [Haloarculaceae archaeon]